MAWAFAAGPLATGPRCFVLIIGLVSGALLYCRAPLTSPRSLPGKGLVSVPQHVVAFVSVGAVVSAGLRAR
eukprot:5775381-Alexandrium_andersonii.AAC.1